MQLNSLIAQVFQHCRALTVNLQKIIYNSQASVVDSDRQYTIILFISNIFLPTILNFLNDREGGGGAIICCRILAPPPSPMPLYLTILLVMTKRGGGVPLSFA